MTAELTSTLPFLVVDEKADDDHTMGIFRKGEREVTRRQIPVAVLRENVKAAVAELRAIFDEVAEDAGRLRLREVQIGFEVTASGGINLIGTAELGATGAITLTFRE